MATRSVTRSLPALSSLIFRSAPSLSVSAAHCSTFSLLRLRPLSEAVVAFLRHILPSTSVQSFSTHGTALSLNDPNSNWSDGSSKGRVLLEGCDFEHWFVVMEAPEGDPSRDEIIGSYIKTLAMVVGSEEEARKKIYSVSTRCYFAFGANVSEEVSLKISELPNVRWVVADSYLDVRNKDYGGEPFIDGKAVPYDPKYHAEWIRNNARVNESMRWNDKPRHSERILDRFRNLERRREFMKNRDFQSPKLNSPSSMGGSGGPPPNNFQGGAPPSNYGGGAPPINYGGQQAQPSNFGGEEGPIYHGRGRPSKPEGGMLPWDNFGGEAPEAPPSNSEEDLTQGNFGEGMPLPPPNNDEEEWWNAG